MKRLCFLVMLMVLGSSAHAGSSLSFVVGGHRVRIEAPRHCKAASCLSVSIPRIHQNRRGDRDDDDRAVADQVKAPVTVQQPAPVPAVPPPNNPAVAPVAAAPPPAVFKPAATATQEVPAPPPAVAPALVLPPVPPPPPPTMLPPAETSPPPAVAAPQTSRVSHRVEDEPSDTPIGDWQSEGNKGTVRIERCGAALCGYALKSSSDDKGEAVLVNMKPKTKSQWTGNVYSHDSGDTYYGTMALKGTEHAAGRSLRAGKVLLFGQQLEPDRHPAGETDHVAADLVRRRGRSRGSGVVGFRLRAIWQTVDV